MPKMTNMPNTYYAKNLKFSIILKIRIYPKPKICPNRKYPISHSYQTLTNTQKFKYAQNHKYAKTEMYQKFKYVKNSNMPNIQIFPKLKYLPKASSHLAKVTRICHARFARIWKCDFFNKFQPRCFYCTHA